MHDQITEKLDGANVTHQHSALPKAAEEARGVVLHLREMGVKRELQSARWFQSSSHRALGASFERASEPSLS